MKEFFRKSMVSLKRKPQNIPFFTLIAAFVYYSFNLTKISDTTAKIQGANMGLCGFITMLFSMLVLVCFLNAFPRRQKPNVIMLTLVYLMLALICGCDFMYRSRILIAMGREGFDSVLEQSPYIYKALTVMNVHIVLIIVVAVVLALLPVYSKWLKKINTNIDLDYSKDMGAIDIAAEE